jgi:ubiquinone/menaquinone biosynthesis C-methylase UbiE
MESMKGQLGLAPGQDLVEIGCGTGQLTGWLASVVAPGRVVAIDFSAAMLAEARRRNVPAEFWQLDICGDSLGTDRFDVALCFNAFPHFRDQPAALRRIAQSLRPGGRVLILHLTGSAELNAFHQNLNGPVCHDLLPARDQWPTLIEGCGLRLDALVDQTDLFLLTAGRA